MLTSGSHTAEKVNEEGTGMGGEGDSEGSLSGKQTPPIRESCLAETRISQGRQEKWGAYKVPWELASLTPEDHTHSP